MPKLCAVRRIKPRVHVAGCLRSRLQVLSGCYGGRTHPLQLLLAAAADEGLRNWVEEGDGRWRGLQAGSAAGVGAQLRTGGRKRPRSGNDE